MNEFDSENGTGNVEERLPDAPQAIRIFVLSFMIFIVIGLVGVVLKLGKLLFLAEIVLILPALALVRLRNYSLVDTFRWYPVSGRVASISGLLGVALAILADEMDRLTQLVMPVPDEMLEALYNIMSFNSFGEFLLLFVSAVVMAAFAEELLFRGLIQGALERKGVPAWAVSVSAMLFTFMHLDLYHLLQFFAVGMFIGYLTWRSQSVMPAIIVHGVNNMLGLTFFNVEEQYLTWYVSGEHVSPPVLVVAAAAMYYGMRAFSRWSVDGTAGHGQPMV